MIFAFLLAVCLVFVHLVAYLILRKGKPGRSSIKKIRSWMLIGFPVLLSVGLLLKGILPVIYRSTITTTGFTILLAGAYFTLPLFLVGLVSLANQLFHFAPKGLRLFRNWTYFTGIVLIVLTLLVGNYKFHHPQITHLNITADHPIQKKSVYIVAISDIHLGYSVSMNMFRQHVQLINAQKPDIVLILGDLIDRTFKPQWEAELIANLRTIRAPLGCYAILGNHEYYNGGGKTILRCLREAGVTVLVDSACLIQNSFYLIGRDDRIQYDRKPLSELTSGLDPSFPKILLDHEPFELEQACLNKIDLQLSGHTHNGQFYPAKLYTERHFEKAYGYLRKGKTQYFISSGLGLWGPPFRIGTNSELVSIRFHY